MQPTTLLAGAKRARKPYIMKRYTQLPFSLYRTQPGLPVRLRSYEEQAALGRSSFDVVLHDGLVLPMPEGAVYTTPNGMSLRPLGENFERILRGFRGEPQIYALRGGITLPEGLVVLHERTDHYSLQTTVPLTLAQFNDTLTEFLRSLPRPATKAQILEWLEDEDDQDN
ncbi:uncharacterized protein LOC62_02G001964 [Vanrija pseudolonga]|uniref:Tse2 ADP-ribosyltransferase toxin domain-containing protein n=1 Tax=Vanrija pseudolonga TaxID=143232 RepID=A0AAF1BGA5_9TREE|nr:hypothetical protein LOC62_02G001964 [Vanrija pseudolonga]